MKGEMTVHVARMGQQGNEHSHRDFCGKLEGNGASGRLNSKFQDNIEIKLRELGRDEVEQFFLYYSYSADSHS